MFCLTRLAIRNRNTLQRTVQNFKKLNQQRTFLSQAYYCKEVWDQRFKDPILQKVNLDELYSEIDQSYQKTKNMSAVDVDVFVNAANEELYCEEMLDLVHKLRMSADSSNTLNSTSHAVIRNLINFNKVDQLLEVLDDRLNYGIFLDDFTSSILLDVFWKNKDFLAGARVASQLMLQEDFGHPLNASLSLLHCCNYLLNPKEWPQPSKPEEPEDEIKIRISYLRNPYDDNHFDLKDPLKIVGKTIMMVTKKKRDTLEKSLYLVGAALFDHEEAKTVMTNLKTDKLYNISNLIPDDNPLKEEIKSLQIEETNIDELLQDHVKSALSATSEKDISLQCENYLKWEQERKEALERQHQRLLRKQRLEAIEDSQQKLKDKERLLWYFENEEKIELQIEDKKAQFVESEKTHKARVKSDEEYIPPEIKKKHAV